MLDWLGEGGNGTLCVCVRVCVGDSKCARIISVTVGSRLLVPPCILCDLDSDVFVYVYIYACVFVYVCVHFES